MARTRLSDGRELTPDLNRLTISEYRALFTADQTADEGDAIIARVYGLPAADVASLPLLDYKRLSTALIAAAREPVDPN